MTARNALTAALAAAALLLAACAPQPARPPVDAAANAALARRLDHWQLSGKIAVRQDDHGHSGFLTWRQDGERYRIRVAGPLGTGGFTVDGGPGAVTLITADRQVTAASPEQLLDKALGWHIPVSPLIYWVRGLPAPGGLESIQYDKGLPATLSQNGWQVAFASFTTVDAVVLPSRLVLARGDVRIIVVIKQWQLPDGAVADQTPTAGP